MDARPCPCGGGAYHRCCGPLHRGERRAATALELMRSRFSAYALALADYLIATHASPDPEPARRDRLARSFGRTRWTGLRIVDTVAGGPADPTGIVEFEAAHETEGRPGVLRERSSFERRDGAWLYVDAAARVGRNDPCPCGSGRKFKKCCGRPQP